MSTQVGVGWPIRTVQGLRTRAWRASGTSLRLGMGILATLLIVATVAFVWTPYSPTETGVAPVFAPPSLAHPFGADRLGADILSRVMAAAATDVGITVAVVAIALTIGTMWGAVSGFYGGSFDFVTLRILEILNAFPSLLLAMLVIAIAGPGMLNVILVVALLPLPDYVRLSRAEILSKKTWQFAEAAKIVGRRPFWVLLRHLLPNSLRPVMTYASINASHVAATVGALGFLGLGIQPGSAEWGSMIARGQDAVISGQWWISFFPGVAIFLLAAAFHLIGDGMADARDGIGG